jgi:hypothetical protein
MNTDRLESLSELTAKYCFENLDLDSAELGSEYSYPNLLDRRELRFYKKHSRQILQISGC